MVTDRWQSRWETQKAWGNCMQQVCRGYGPLSCSPPFKGLSTLGSVDNPARFQAKPPACYRAPWRLPGTDLHRQATTSF
jgi:hypothetical protein